MSQRMLEGKKGIILGVANKWSIAWGIARAASSAGAELAFTYQGEKFRPKVAELIDTLPPPARLYACDVTLDDDVERLAEIVKRDLGRIETFYSAVFGNFDCLIRIRQILPNLIMAFPRTNFPVIS